MPHTNLEVSAVWRNANPQHFILGYGWMDGWMDEKKWKIRIGNNTDIRHVRHTSTERGEQDIIRTDISSLARNRWWDRATHRQDLPANTGLTENSVSSYMHRHIQTQTLTCKSWWGSINDLKGCTAVTVAPPTPNFFPLPCSLSSPFQCSATLPTLIFFHLLSPSILQFSLLYHFEMLW